MTRAFWFGAGVGVSLLLYAYLPWAVWLYERARP
jgi:hypothetical protein